MNYINVPVTAITDKELNATAKAVYTIIVKMTEAAERISAETISKYCKENVATISKAIRTLETYGYLNRTRNRINGRLSEAVYEIIDK